MAYTWEEVMLGIDVRKEMSEKEEAARKIEEKQLKEQKRMSGWSLGLSLLGAISPLGLLGYTIGKQIGKIGADLWGPGSDWEEDVAALEYLTATSSLVEPWLDSNVKYTSLVSYKCNFVAGEAVPMPTNPPAVTRINSA